MIHEFLTQSAPEQHDLTFVSKGWGYEHWFVNKKEYCGKLLFFKRGRKCSFHYHKIKDETFYIHKGRLKVWWSMDDNLPTLTVKGDVAGGITILESGDTFYVPTGMRHMMEGLEDTEMFEFSTQHFDNDSYRIIKGD